MTQGISPLESEPDSRRPSRTYNFIERSNSKRCLNILPIQQFALKINQPLPQLELPFSDDFVTTILEKHLHYANQYADMLQIKISQREFATQIRMRLFEVQTIKTAFGNFLVAIIAIAACCKTLRYKVTLLILFAIWITQPIQAAPTTTIQGLYNTLLYIRFRINYSWLPSGFGSQQYEEMQSALVNAIIQLQQAATPPPTTTTTQAPVFQTNDERIHDILHSFINKTLNNDAEEREENKCDSGLTKQQEQMYATE